MRGRGMRIDYLQTKEMLPTMVTIPNLLIKNHMTISAVMSFTLDVHSKISRLNT